MLRNECISDYRLDAKGISLDDECCIPVKDKASINLKDRNRYRLLSNYCLFLRLATR